MGARILLTRAIFEDEMKKLKDAGEVWTWAQDAPIPRKTLMERIRGVDGVLSMLTDRIDADVIAAAGPGLKVISNYAVGFDNIDVEEATRRGVAVGNTPGVLTEATADLAFSLLMAAARRLVEGGSMCREGRFAAWSPTSLLGADVHGATLGVLGMGRIGRAVARRARGFDMKVIYKGGNKAGDEALEDSSEVTFEELLERSDFLSIHAPLNESTRRIIDEKALSRMKPGAIIINTARGPLIDHEALYRALKNRRIAFAALDVTEPEPLPGGHPLLSLDNCLVVPHLGSATRSTRRKMAEMAVDNLIAGLRGEKLPFCVNPKVRG